MRRALCLMAVLALAGCAARFDEAGVEWGKRGVEINQVTLDELECARSASDAGWTPDLLVGGLVDVARVVIDENARSRSYTGCMTAKGYTRRG